MEGSLYNMENSLLNIENEIFKILTNKCGVLLNQIDIYNNFTEPLLLQIKDLKILILIVLKQFSIKYKNISYERKDQIYLIGFNYRYDNITKILTRSFKNSLKDWPSDNEVNKFIIYNNIKYYNYNTINPETGNTIIHELFIDNNKIDLINIIKNNKIDLLTENYNGDSIIELANNNKIICYLIKKQNSELLKLKNEFFKITIKLNEIDNKLENITFMDLIIKNIYFYIIKNIYFYIFIFSLIILYFLF